MSEIILIKPAASNFKEQNRVLGNLDLPVSEEGQEELAKAIPLIKEYDLDTLYSSPCNPCKDSSEIIADKLDISLKEKNSLKNFDLGLWQGLQIDEIRRKQPKVFKQWLENPETICPPEGESVEDAAKRVKKTVAKIKKRKGRCGIIVSEPLASLIRSIVQETDLSFQSLVQNNHEITVEKIYPVPETSNDKNCKNKVSSKKTDNGGKTS